MLHKIETRKHPIYGTQCVIQYPSNRNPAQSLEENAIAEFGPRLMYNSLPKYLSDIERVKTEKFKFELGKFLESSFLMSSKCSTMSPQQEATASSTSYLISGLKEFTKVVESLTRPWSGLSCFETTPSIQM